MPTPTDQEVAPGAGAAPGGVPERGMGRTVIEVEADPQGRRARCTLRAGDLSPHLLDVDGRGARVALVARRALLLAGDHVRIDVVVGPGAWLELVETSGTVAYDAGGVESSWAVRARLGPDARLVWEGLPFVVATGANVRRHTDVVMARGAVVALREVIVVGRTGEAGGRITAASTIELDDAPLLAEELALGHAESSAVTLGASRVLDTVTVAGARPAAHRDGGPLRLDLAGPGAMSRAVAAHTHGTGLDEVWRAWAETCDGRADLREG